jgi:DNA-binding GntR family transcriptional regulator
MSFSKTSEKSRTNLTENAYQAIKNAITTERYSTGQKLTYGDLEKSLRMSKTPIVLAMSRLVDEGLVRHVKNRGYYVNGIKNNLNTGSVPALFNLDFSLPPTSDPTISLTRAVYEKIKELIQKLKLVPGQKLVYADLAEAIGVSKTPVINALARLESDGFVQYAKNTGYYVKELKLEEVRAIFEARELMELANVDLILKNHTLQEVMRLEDIHQAHISLSTDVYTDEKLRINRQFHLCLAGMGHNPLMVKYIEDIYEQFDIRLKMNFNFLEPERVKEVNQEHHDILDALQNNDGIRFKRALQKHLQAPARDIFRHIKKIG